MTAKRFARTSIITLLLSLCLISAPAGADGFSLLLNGKAIHLDRKPGVNYNENNWGLGVQYDLAPVAEKWVPFVAASGFKDSNNIMTYYAGGGYLHRSKFEWGKTPMHFDAGAIVFVMKRKNFRDGDPFLGLLPAASLGTPRVSLNMSFLPRIDPKSVPTLFFQLKLAL